MTAPALTPSQKEVLHAIPSRTPIEAIDRIWIFPPRHHQTRESGLFVLATNPYTPAAEGVRTLCTIRYQAEANKQGRIRRTETTTEEGSAPAERIDKVIAGVLRRDAEPGEPWLLEVGGSPERWAEVIAELLPDLTGS